MAGRKDRPRAAVTVCHAACLAREHEVRGLPRFGEQHPWRKASEGLLGLRTASGSMPAAKGFTGFGARHVGFCLDGDAPVETGPSPGVPVEHR